MGLHTKEPRAIRWDWILGALLILIVSGWGLLSREFIYGQGHFDRPILEFVILYLAGWGVWVAAAWRARRQVPSLKIVLIVAFLVRAVLLPSNLILENDVYRYVLDGQVLLSGENPYEYSPLVLPELGESRLRESLSSQEAQQVLSRIGYPHIPTVYPPMAQIAFAGGALIGGWDWLGQRMFFLGLDLSVICLLIWLLPRFGLARGWVFLYAWNPLVLKEVANSSHLDVLVAVFLLACLAVLGRSLPRHGSTAAAVAGGTLGLATLSKLYPLILLPACLLYLWRLSGSLRPVLSMSAAVLATVVLGYFPFLDIGWERLTAGLSTFAVQWDMNEGAFGVLMALKLPRWIPHLIIAVATVLIPASRRSRSVAELAEDFQWILLIWFLLIPTPFPWYALPLSALHVLRQGRHLVPVLSVLFGVIGLYYLSFFFEYHNFSSSWWFWTRVAEHGTLWSLLFIPLAVRYSRVFLKPELFRFNKPLIHPSKGANS